MDAELKALGLKEYEAKVYLALLRYGKLDAKQLAAHSGVPQNRIYETVETLRRLGFVDILLGYPKQFEAVDPKIALPHYLELKEHELAGLREEAERLAAQLRKAEPGKPEIGVWSVVRSRAEIADRRLALFNSAKKSKKLIVSTTRPPEKEFAYKKAVRAFKQRGVVYKVIRNTLPITEKQASWYRYMEAEGAEMRLTELPLHMKMCIIDGELACIESTEGPEEGWFLIWTNSKPIVAFLDTYFDLLWEGARPPRAL